LKILLEGRGIQNLMVT